MDQALDRQPVSALQWRTFIIVTCAIVLEGFDIQLMGLAAPAILADWGITRQAIGPSMAAALIGMVIGSAFGGYAGDRFGRRPLLIGCITLFSACTFATAFAVSLTQLFVLRLIAGVGFGAVIANAPALIAEWMPRRLRVPAAAAVVLGTPCGGMVGAALSAWLIPEFGWRTAFLAGGLLPLIVAASMIFLLPESPRYLSMQSGRLEKSASQRSRPIAELLSTFYRRSTFGLWIAFFASLSVSYAFFSWIPVMLTGLGFQEATAIRGLLYYNLFGVVAALSGSWIATRTGSKPVLTTFVLIGVISVATLSWLLLTQDSAAAIPPAIPLLGLIMAGIASTGSQALLYGIAAHAYHTEVRASGVGLAASIGRIGAIASAYGGGIVLSGSAGPSAFLSIICVLFILIGCGVWIIDRHVPRGTQSVGM